MKRSAVLAALVLSVSARLHRLGRDAPAAFRKPASSAVDFVDP